MMQACWLTRGFSIIFRDLQFLPLANIYGDPVYPLRVHLQAPFCQGHPTPQIQAYNGTMSEVRVSVEWLFDDIINSLNSLITKKI